MQATCKATFADRKREGRELVVRAEVAVVPRDFPTEQHIFNSWALTDVVLDHETPALQAAFLQSRITFAAFPVSIAANPCS